MGHLNLPKRIHQIPKDFKGDFQALNQRWEDAKTIEDLKLHHDYINRPLFKISDGNVVLDSSKNELSPPSWYDNLIKKYEHLDKQVENDIIETYLLFKRKSPN